MKIVYNTDQVFLHGGIEKVMATKANYFAKLSGYEVFIVTTEQNKKAPCYPLDEKITLIDLDVNYNRDKSYFSKENLQKAIKHFRRQRKLFREIKPDIIISPNYNFDFYWLPFIARNAKKIKEIHSSRYNWKPTLKNRINAWFEKKYDRIVVLNKDEASYFKTNNITIIPNPIEQNDYRAKLENKQVISAGRISPVKGFDQLISAWKVVNMQFPDWQLHIFGQDYIDTQEKLQEQINNLGLQHVIYFKGNVSDLPKTMTEYSIYAMSSITECFPMVLLEALSVGLPVVSYDCPNGPRNIISQNVDGLLVENQNPNALATGIIKLIENEELRSEYERNGKVNAERFYVDFVMREWEKLFESLKNN